MVTNTQLENVVLTIWYFVSVKLYCGEPYAVKIAREVRERPLGSKVGLILISLL